MNIRELQKAVYKQAVEKGLYITPQTPKALLWHIRAEAQEAVKALAKYRDIKTHYECHSRFMEDCLKVNFNCAICPKRSNEGVDQELADVIIMTLSACEHMGIDITEAIERKMAYNAMRER